MQANHWSIQLSLTTRSPRWRLCTKLVNPFLVPLIIAIIDSSPALSHGACVIKLSKSAWKTWTSITFHKLLELKLNKCFSIIQMFRLWSAACCLLHLFVPNDYAWWPSCSHEQAGSHWLSDKHKHWLAAGQWQKEAGCWSVTLYNNTIYPLLKW